MLPSTQYAPRTTCECGFITYPHPDMWCHHVVNADSISAVQLKFSAYAALLLGQYFNVKQGEELHLFPSKWRREGNNCSTSSSKRRWLI